MYSEYKTVYGKLYAGTIIVTEIFCRVKIHNAPISVNNRYIDADEYYNSEEHRVIMMRDVADYIGISNQVYNADTATHSQFDVFAEVR